MDARKITAPIAPLYDNDVSILAEKTASQGALLQQAKQKRKSKWGWCGGSRAPVPEDNVSVWHVNEAKDEEINKLKSNLVQLNSTLKDESYQKKKKIEHLEHENLAFNLKTMMLEQET